jgi:hypothetical protein
VNKEKVERGKIEIYKGKFLIFFVCYAENSIKKTREKCFGRTR